MIIEKFNKEEIPYRIYYDTPLPAYKIFSSGYNSGDYPEAEETSSTILSLPLHPSLNENDQCRVIEAVVGALK
jgi:UDP-2-acetamido-2-deoxy-ribo-hexuluronate aminotransferase